MPNDSTAILHPSFSLRVLPTLPFYHFYIYPETDPRRTNLGLRLALGEDSLHGLDGLASINGIQEALILQAALDGFTHVTARDLLNGLPCELGFTGIHSELFGRLLGLAEGISHLRIVNRRGTGGGLGQLDAPKLLGKGFDAADLVLLLLEKGREGLDLLVVVSRSFNNGNASRCSTEKGSLVEWVQIDNNKNKS